MKRANEEWEGMNRKERHAALTLALLCLLAAWSPRLIPDRARIEKQDSARMRQMLSTLEKSGVDLEESHRDPPNRSFADKIGFEPVARHPGLHPFPFDPNRVSREDLEQMGIPEKVVSTWLNYRRKGGRFRYPGSLRKVYGLDEALFTQLEPFIRMDLEIVGAGPDTPARQSEPQANERTGLDINRATSLEWEAIRGIGPVLAARIVRFRDAMGGFTSVEQVAETYGLPDSTFQNMLPRLQCKVPWRKWNVNFLDADSLARHPYLGIRQARAIVAYRDQHGPFASIGELRRIHTLTDSLIEKLGPYLDFAAGKGVKAGDSKY